jgi:hypothetical protein
LPFSSRSAPHPPGGCVAIVGGQNRPNHRQLSQLGFFRPAGARVRAEPARGAGIFLLAALMHLLRIIFGWQVEIGGLSIPFWASWLALPVAGALAYFGFTQKR